MSWVLSVWFGRNYKTSRVETWLFHSVIPNCCPLLLHGTVFFLSSCICSVLSWKSFCQLLVKTTYNSFHVRQKYTTSCKTATISSFLTTNVLEQLSSKCIFLPRLALLSRVSIFFFEDLKTFLHFVTLSHLSLWLNTIQTRLEQVTSVGPGSNPGQVR